MAKKMQMPMMEHMKDKCSVWCGWVILLIGVWFLLVDLDMLPGWNINWWSVVFLLIGAKLVYKQFVKK